MKPNASIWSLKLSTDDCKSLWGILWRVLFIAPFIWIFGMAWLWLLMAVLIVPPLYALISFINGNWLPAVLTFVPWLISLRFSRKLLRWTLNGIQYS